MQPHQRLRSAVLLLASATLVAASGTAAAVSPHEIEAAARRASVGTREVTIRLADDTLQGRKSRTEGAEAGRAYLIPLLRKLGTGIGGGTADADYRHEFDRGVNLVAVIPGRELPDEYVVVGAHYDHLGTTETDVFNGATDNAAGVAVVLAIGRALRSLPEPPRRSVVLALWDAEEEGLRGSLAWIADERIPTDATVAYVNLDIQGANLTPSLARTSFAIGAETGGACLTGIVSSAVGAEASAFPDGVDTRQLSYIFGQLRSDYVSFVEAEVPTVFFSDATGACYHTVRDESRFVDFAKLASQSRIAFRVVASLAETTDLPGFVAPDPALATWEDAVTLDRVLTRGSSDLKLFPTEQRRRVLAVVDDVAAIVARGPAAFGEADVATVLGAAAETLAAIGASLPCGGYFADRAPRPLAVVPGG